jgi:ATP-dependent Clp protease ATP-binding subunit ClpC
LLDDTVKLDRAALREFFESRVMGQPEAIDAAVDLVTLIKAGLTDPNKPFGVLLFIGPTGVGKTELARALAEYCFGSAGRLTRFDMSEYATWEAYERLIGKCGQPGTLTSVVREQPFSILLFDEFEKGHLNVYDLCLQIFDAGRLTDGLGQTTDFRRTIIILTSNIGALVGQGAPIGFGQNPLPDVTESQSQRDLRRAFRPEFLNRIDRIVQFHALSEETASRIVRREVDRVLERSGIKRRNLSIDADPSLMPLLLREGYSRVYGARPLKRAIERLILLPLARAIAAGEVRANSLIRLLVRNGSVRVQVHQAEEPEPREVVAAPTRTPADLLARLHALQERGSQFREQVAELSSSKAALLAQTAAPNFWDTPAESQQVFEQIYVLDGVLAQVEGLRKAVQRLAETIAAAGPGKRALRHAARLDDLESYAAHVALLLACREPKPLGDAVLSVTRVGGQGESLAAVERIATMYLKFARRRHFKVEVLDDHCWQSPPQDSISLLISGVGAHLLLATEQGLHALSRGVGRMDAGQHPEREIVRVDVGLVDSAAPAIGRNDLRVTMRPLAHVSGRLMRRARTDVQLLHPASMVSLRAWTDCDEQAAVERLMPLLQARINMVAHGVDSSYGKESLVRRYRLGPSQLVRDARTGRKSGRLGLVFDGHLDAFLVALAPTEVERQ